MTVTLDRRDLIKAALGGAVGLGLPIAAIERTLAAGNAGLNVTALAPNMVMISGAGGNVLAATDEKGIVMVDGGRAETAGALLKTVSDEFPGKAVHTLFNTHWHPEQTGANRELSRTGAEIIAHANTKLWLSTEIKRPWENKAHPPLPSDARPTQTFYNEGTTAFAGGQIEYGYLRQAHTDGDIYVYFPGPNVLHTGGVLSTDGWPLIDWWTGGWIGGLAKGLDALVKVADENTRIVPATGLIIDRAALRAHRDMYMTIYKRVREMLYNALSPAEAVAAEPAREFEDKMGPSDEFVEMAFKSLWGHFTPDA